MVKLDLINSREFPSTQINRVFDSSQALPVFSAINKGACSSTVSFKSKALRTAKDPIPQGPLIHDRSDLDSRCNIVDIKKRVEGSTQYLKFNLREVDDGPKASNRIDTPCMNRVIENSHEIAGETIWNRVATGSVGGQWSTIPKPEDKPTTTPGCGQYDITAYERGRFGNKSCATKFNSIPREVCEPLKLEEGDDDNEMDQLDSIFTKYSTLSKHGVTKISQDDRWEATIYRQEKFVKTTGMTLPCDYDKVFDKRVAMSFDKQAPRPEPFTIPITWGVNIVPDCGNKATLVTQLISSPVRYSAAFNSKVASGPQIPPPTSGVQGGPCSYPEAFATCVEVKNPDKPSYTFMRERTFPVRKYGPVEHFQHKPFSEENSNGAWITKPVKRRSHMAQWTKKKIARVYPSLAHRKYDNPDLNFDINRIKDSKAPVAMYV